MDLSTIKAKLRGAGRSWTIRANALVAVLLLNMDTVMAYAPQLAPYMPQDKHQRLMLVLTVLNMALRFRTTKSLADK
jgi:hypothetical protein